MSRRIVITPKAKDIGDNFVVRRSLPHLTKQMVGPYIFWDHMGPITLEGEQEMKVRSHPHIGLATITYLFQGEILHRDSLGTEQPIRPGEVNWMTAGNGIAHSERAKPVKGAITLEGIQLWVALPIEFEDVDASFFHTKEKDLPFFEHSGAQLKLIAGEDLGQKSPVPVYSDLFYYHGKTSNDFEYQLSPKREGAIYLLKGEIEIDDQSYSGHDLICFDQGENIHFKVKGDTEFMFFGGTPFPEKRYIWWNYVSSSMEKIEAAKKRWKEDESPTVINETEKIPLPTDR